MDPGIESFKEFNDLDIDDDEGEMIESEHQRSYQQISMIEEEPGGYTEPDGNKDSEKEKSAATEHEPEAQAEVAEHPIAQ